MKNGRFGGGGYGVRDLTRATATSMSVALGDQSCDCFIGGVRGSMICTRPTSWCLSCIGDSSFNSLLMHDFYGKPKS